MSLKDKDHESRPILVTQPALPDLHEFVPYLEQIWKNRWLTNSGPFHRQLEKELAVYLDVPYVSLFANGTLALITALQVLKISNEVITTPYSFVATTHSLLWNNIRPVFVDIEPKFCNIDPDRIEAAITPQTTAILPVHVYGIPCSHERIQKIADVHSLKVIYDAAHCFGVNHKGRGICNLGDLSILSFHATKVFNTMEGGAIICHDEATKKRIDSLKNFGFTGETTVIDPGINSKMNEMQAALGLVQLKHIEKLIEKRKHLVETYRKELHKVKGIRFLPDPAETELNYAYFPIFVDEQKYGASRDRLYEMLKENSIYARRYFYPIISDFPMYKGLESARPSNLPVAKKVADRVICLPLFPDLEMRQLQKICSVVRMMK